VLHYDNLAGLIAITWMGSGLWRVLGGVEKGTAYYVGSSLFWVKMGILGGIWALESWPMVTFIRWRVALARERPVTPSPGQIAWMRRVHFLELGLIVAAMLAAALMARGVGWRAAAPAAAALGGAEIYRQHCQACHQPDGRGLGGRLAADLGTRLHKPDEALLRSIAGGVQGTAMVGFQGRLSEAQMREVLVYVRSAFAVHVRGAFAPPVR
jgi:putative membrane protein